MDKEILRILILEDNPADAELVQFELEDAGLAFTAKVVMTRNDFIQELTEFPPDIILSDYDLPQYTGALALAEAKERRPDIPFILVTGAITEDRAIETLTSGAKDYVMKTRLHRLVPAIHRALEEAKEIKARKAAERELQQSYKNLTILVAERTAALQAELAERKNIEEILQKNKTRLEILSYIAGRLLESDNPQNVVEELCLKVMEFLDCQTFFNFLVDEPAGRLYLNACAGIPKAKMQEIKWLDYGVAVCGCVARDGCRMVAESIQETPNIRTELVKSFGIRAYACHPLLDRGQTIGTLSFGTRTRDTFNPDDLSMMKAVADQVAVAMSRIRVEKAMLESNKEYRELVENANSIIIRMDQKGMITFFNEYAQKYFGYKRDEILGKNVRILIPPIESNGKNLHEMADDILRNPDEHEENINENIRKNGERIWVSWRNRAIIDSRGNIVGNLAIGQDITDRKQAEDALSQSQSQFNLLIKNIKAGMALIDDTGKFTIINPAFLRMFGLKDDQSIKNVNDQNWSDWQVFESDGSLLPVDEHPVRKAAITGKAVRNKLVGVRLPAGGDLIWMLISADLIFRPDGSIQSTICTYNDITEYRQLEEELRENEQKYRSIFENSLDAIFLAIPNRRIKAANPAACALFGMTEEELCQAGFKGIEDPRDPRHAAAIEELAQIGRVKYEATYVRKDGSMFPSEVSSIIMDDGSRSLFILRDISERKQAEETLRDSEERMRYALESSHTGAWSLNLRDHSASRSFEHDHIFGYTELLPQWTYETFLDHVLPEDRAEVDARFQESMRDGSDWSFDCRIRRIDGEIRWIWASGRQRKAADGEPLYLIGIVQDITERKRTEESLKDTLLDTQRNRSSLEAMLAAQNDAVLMYDAEMNVQQVNAVFPDIYGFNPVGLNVRDIIKRVSCRLLDGRPLLLEEQPTPRALSGEKVIGVRFIVKRADGTDIVVESSSCPIRKGDRITGVVTVWHDSNEQVKTEEFLRRSSEKIETILSSMTDIYIAYDRDWRFIDLNKQAENVIGKSRDEILDRVFWEVFPRMKEGEFHRQYLIAMETQTPVHFEAVSIFGRWYEAHAYPSENGLAVYFKDITKRKQAELHLAGQAAELQQRTSQLEAINRELESFSYFVSHDLRAPLRAIDGYTKMILRKQGDKFNEETRRQFDQVRESARAMGQLIDDLLTLSKLDRQDLDIKIIDICGLIEEIWRGLQSADPDRRMTLKMNVLPLGRGDKGLLKQVFINLLSNALKFSRRQDTAVIEVGGYEKENENGYYVKDNGVGFDMKYHDKMFGAFQRLHSAAEYEGTGIGLAIVQRIVHHHGGRVWAEGKVDEGAAFYFTLPRERNDNND